MPAWIDTHCHLDAPELDRKSTRLNSSHLVNSYAVFCLKKKTNVFMGQTEAPLIVKPYVPRMTRSELLALMVGGMAHISGGLMAVYIGIGADPSAILPTTT